MNRLFCNIDCTCFFHTPLDGRKGNSGEAVDRYVERIAEAGVTDLLINTNARRTSYRSSAWEAFWDGYDPDGPDTQPFLASMHPEDIAPYRQSLNNMLALHRAGVDYPARMLAAARRNGMKGWITLRMNDVHNGNNRNHPFHGRFWREHPEFFRQNCPGYFATALDYAQPEVREFFASLIAETLDRYDIDGLELDFMREPYLFSRDEEVEGKRILTEWLKEIRELVQNAAERLGHPVMLGARVPSDPDTAARMGLDAVAWAGAGIVDLIVPTPRWTTMEFDMPMIEWRERLKGTDAKLAGGLEVRVQATPAGKHFIATPEHAMGAAAAILSGGADAVYLFNYFPSQHPNWPTGDYVSALRAMKSLSKLARSSRRHTMTYRDIIAPGEEYQPPLPAEGNRLEFRLPTGPRPPVQWKAVIEIGVDGAAKDDCPDFMINGNACQIIDEMSQYDAEEPVLSYNVPEGGLADGGRNLIVVSAPGGKSVKVISFEIRIAPEI